MHKNVSARPRSKGNTVWALIMSWLSSLLLTLLAFFLVLLTTICSPAFMKQQVAHSGFSETAYTYLYDNFVSYGASSGFSADVMTSAISRDQITADMDSAVTRLYDGDTALDSRDSIQTATYDALLANLNARGVDVTSDVESAVAIVADACRLDYANYVAIPLASQLYTIIEKFDRIVPISVAAMALVCAASIFLMLRLAASPRFAVRCLTFAFTASAVLCSIGATALVPAMHLNNLNLNPASVKQLIITYVQNLFGRFGLFALVYGALAVILLALTFGYTMIVAETSIGRMTGKSPVGAFQSFGKSRWLSAGGWLNAVIPILIVPYYSVIGGWVVKYLAEYVLGHGSQLAADGYFGSFISNGVSTELCFVIFAVLTLAVIFAGVENGIERVSKFMMPVLVVLSIIIAVYSVTRPGALAGVKYFLVPDIEHFSWMTVVAAMGQMFYSLSIAMGILITFGSYMKKDISIEGSTRNVEVFDTAIAIMAGLMIIPAVFAFSGGDPAALNAGPSLMFITIPKVFDSMGLGTAIGILFFILVLFAALTSSIALTESAVSTFQDELGWGRKKSTAVVGVVMLALGTLSSLGYGPLAGVTIIGMQFLDFFDFLTNSVMMPIAAIAICLLVSRVIGVEKIEEEVTQEGGRFRRKAIFNFMIRYLCPLFAAIILVSSVANALGWIKM